jgi:NOL1/NOP2/sun family putative RNA methylase
MEKTYKYQPKPEFEQRMNELLKLAGSNEKDKDDFWKIVHQEPQNSIRCNTLKISPSELKARLEKLGWKTSQPFEKEYPEIMIIENALMPGELGKTHEHILGYYYVQEISSMLPIIALNPTNEDKLLDLCASPGSKTTQAASFMKNSGAIIANDNNIGRIIILASNLEKCGVSNTILTSRDGVQLCRRFKENNIEFDKILVDAPCSGEGTLRSSPKTFLMWNLNTIEFFGRQQKALASNALQVLKEGGEMIYSTCTHSPEEDEEVVQFLLDNYDIKLEKFDLPIKSRKGILGWKGKKFSKEMQLCHRIYPQDNNTEGFFLCKIKKLSNKIKKR